MTYFEGELMRWYLLAFVLAVIEGTAASFNPKDFTSFVALSMAVTALVCVIRLLF